MGRGYSGTHPRYSKHGDERYDAKEAYNKDLTASARLHYLENDRHDHTSPATRLSRAERLRKRAMKRSERTGAERGDEYDYEDPRVQKMLEKANELDERSGKGRKAMNKLTKRIEKLPDGPVWGDTQEDDSPLSACAKSEGGSGCVQERGGEWKVISNKTGKPWPANYGSKANAEAALRGYHAG